MDKLPKSIAKVIKSLQIKKYRSQHQLFLVQGEKSFLELLKSDFQIKYIVATEEFYEKRPGLEVISCEKYKLNTNDLSALSSLTTNNTVLAAVQQKQNEVPKLSEKEFFLVLDDVRDPGNLGTIMRTADWFGVKNIIASETTADLYNPKVISSSMGSFTRINIYYTSLLDFFREHSYEIYVADTKGEDIHTMESVKPGAIVLGNESNGPGAWIEEVEHQKITIPGGANTESLNVAVSSGILLDRFVNIKSMPSL